MATGRHRTSSLPSSAHFALGQESQPHISVVFSFFLRDAERKRKVKELMGSLASQEGEWKALKKRKRK